MIVVYMSLIGAIIGWSTNIVAVRLLFRPIQPIKIPFTPFAIQGLIPKRHADIALSVSRTIEKELIDLEDLLRQMIESMDKAAVLSLLKEKLTKSIKAQLPTLLQSFSGTIEKYVNEMVDQQGEGLLTEVTETLMHKALEKVSISELVEKRILALDMESMEMMIIDLAKKELKQIELLGGVLGFLIGIIQGLIVLAWG